MKRLILIILALVLTMSMLASCTGGLFGNDETTGSESEETSSETTGTSGTGTSDTETSGTETSGTETSGTETSGTETSETETTTTPVEDSLTDALEYLRLLYKDPATTGGNYDLMTVVTSGDDSFTITWTVSVDSIQVVPTEGKENTVTVVVPGEPTEDIPYVLTATVTGADGKSGSIALNKTVPKFKYATYAEYVAAEDDAPLAIIGLVSGVQSKSTGSGTNAIFVQDLNNEGGYYVYGLSDDPYGVIEVGMTVDVRGVKDDYNGTYELKSATVKIVDETIKPVTPVDYTEIFANAESTKDTALVDKQGMLVTIKGVTILGDGGNGYREFELNGLTSYVRISSSNNPCTSEDIEAIEAAFAANRGNTADVTGLITLYNGAFYLMPVGADAFSNFVVPERTDAQKVALELDALTVSNRFFNAEGTLTVPVEGSVESAVAITWASNNAVVTVNGANVTVGTVTEITRVTLTATLTAGEATDTKAFELVLMPATVTVDQVIGLIPELQSGEAIPGTFNFEGEVVSIDTEWSDQYKNITVTIKIGDTSIQCYRLSGDGAETIAVGDTIKVTGSLSNYNGKIQLNKPTMYHEHVYTTLANKCDVCGEITEHDCVDAAGDNKCDLCGKDIVVTMLTIPEVLTSEDGTDVVFTGTVKSIKEPWTTQYNNMSVYVVDADNNEIYVFRTTTQVNVGDVVVVTGTVGSYNGAKQIAQGSTIEITSAHVHTFTTLANKCDECSVITDHTCKDDNTDDVCDLCGESTKPVEVTVAEALAADDGAKVILKGTVASIKEPWTTQYGNMSVYLKDDAGNSILLFRITVEVGVGDVITVTGEVGSYNGTKQIAQGSTVVIDVKHTDCVDEDSNCVCDVCEKATTCVDDDNNCVCDICEKTIPCVDANEDGSCDVCDKVVEQKSVLAKFDFGDKVDSTTHDDGDDIGTTKSYTSGTYTLNLENASKAYDGGNDAQGNSILKLGTTKAVGTFTFTVADDVSEVIIYVAGYKANTGKVVVNGTTYTVETGSNNGAYTAIKVDTSTNKTVTFATDTTAYRAVVDAIEFLG